jgi:5-methyltetrahydropteroyltriglutamate--homocysteine methyltransferase
LILLADLLPLVDDPEQFEQELRALDVPAAEVRHRAVFGPLGRSRPLAGHELAFARELINAVAAGFPREQLALHMCRDNWTPDESACVSGSYEPLVATLSRIEVGTCLLELCTPRAGEMEVLAALPDDRGIGVGVVNQKHAHLESVDEITAQVQRAIALFGRERVLLNPDCGFATFADNPVSSAQIAERKLRAMVEASRRLRGAAT